MALHGGLEEGTATIAREAAAASAASFYAVVQPEGLWWHVPSIRYDPRQSTALASFLDYVRAAISLHGFGEPGFEATALLGGRNRVLARRLHNEFRSRGLKSVSDLAAIPRRLQGTHSRNPVNRPALGGVQVELAMELRSGRNRALVIDALVSCIRGTDLAQLAAATGS
jgi:phage replication-related protein YjqB (UPF0714/DUF867 family)